MAMNGITRVQFAQQTSSIRYGGKQQKAVTQEPRFGMRFVPKTWTARVAALGGTALLTTLGVLAIPQGDSDKANTDGKDPATAFKPVPQAPAIDFAKGEKPAWAKKPAGPAEKEWGVRPPDDHDRKRIAEEKAESSPITDFYDYADIFVEPEGEHIKSVTYEYAGDRPSGYPRVIYMGKDQQAFEPVQVITLKDGTVLRDTVWDYGMEPRTSQPHLTFDELAVKVLAGKVAKRHYHPVTQKHEVELVSGRRHGYRYYTDEAGTARSQLNLPEEYRDPTIELAFQSKGDLKAWEQQHMERYATLLYGVPIAEAEEIVVESEDDFVQLVGSSKSGALDIAFPDVEPGEQTGTIYFKVTQGDKHYFYALPQGNHSPPGVYPETDERLWRRSWDSDGIDRTRYQREHQFTKRFETDVAFAAFKAFVQRVEQASRNNMPHSDRMEAVEHIEYVDGRETIAFGFHTPVQFYSPGAWEKASVEGPKRLESNELSLADATQLLNTGQVANVYQWPLSRVVEFQLRDGGDGQFTHIVYPNKPSENRQLLAAVHRAFPDHATNGIPQRQVKVASVDELLAVANKPEARFWTISEKSPLGKKGRGLQQYYVSVLVGDTYHMLKTPDTYTDARRLVDVLYAKSKAGELATDLDRKRIVTDLDFDGRDGSVSFRKSSHDGYANVHFDNSRGWAGWNNTAGDRFAQGPVLPTELGLTD